MSVASTGHIPWDRLIIALITSSTTYGTSSSAATEMLIYQIGKNEPISLRIVSSNLSYQSLINEIEYYRQENVR